MHRSQLLALTALAALAALPGCSRDLAVPESVPPSVSGVFAPGRETTPAPEGGFPVLAGELVAIHGAGLGESADRLEVRIGGERAPILELSAGRVVVQAPALGATGAADLTLVAPGGQRTVAAALRYDGPGRPAGFTASDLATAVPLFAVAPVEAPGAADSAPELAVAIGASDAATVVSASLGVGITTVPLGVVPVSVAARLVVVTASTFDLEVLAVDRRGALSLGRVRLSSSLAVVARFAPSPVGGADLPGVAACSLPRLLMTRGGARAVATWTSPTGPRLAVLAPGARGAWALRGPVDLAGEVTGWAARSGGEVLLADGRDLLSFNAAAAAPTSPVPFSPAAGPLSALAAAGCGATPPALAGTGAVAFGAADAAQERVAVVVQQGGLDWVLWFDPQGTAPASRALVTAPGALALAHAVDPASGAASWLPVLSSLHALVALGTPAATTSAGCTSTVTASAALPLDADPLATLPASGALLTAGQGTRLLAVTPAHDLVTVLPATLTSPGPVLRLAAYAGLQVSNASVPGVGAVPLAVASRAWLPASSGAPLDTGSAELVIPLSGDRTPLALGGSGYGRGAAWVPGPASTSVLYAGDLPDLGPLGRGGAAAVTTFKADLCWPGSTEVSGSRPVSAGADLVAEGPGRSGAFGPGSQARFGPASAPVYLARGASLDAYATDGAGLACLIGTGSAVDWSGCAAGASIDLGVEPLDVVLSAGDATAAARTLSADCQPCAAPFACSSAGAAAACDPADRLCRTATCAPAASLRLVRPGAAAVEVALPGAPLGVVADRAGGFLVTVACDRGPAVAATRCFAASTLCEGHALRLATGAGALLLVGEDGGAPTCLAARAGLAGPLALTPNGAEAWVVAPTAAGQAELHRFALSRRTADGGLDAALLLLERQVLGPAAATPSAVPAAGLGFSPDGATAVVTVPGAYRVAVVE